jgi:hypothetical protein
MTGAESMHIPQATPAAPEGKGTDAHKPRRLADVPAEAWTRLGEKTIFFGHQSLGDNIVCGIQDLVATHG